ncbi:hypothetical protein L249_6680, partial [Ophiocordyceps polyrhachis-furcata BCC 54312]
MVDRTTSLDISQSVPFPSVPFFCFFPGESLVFQWAGMIPPRHPPSISSHRPSESTGGTWPASSPTNLFLLHVEKIGDDGIGRQTTLGYDS